MLNCLSLETGLPVIYMKATAVAHPNVALIKYWGKRAAAANLPAVGSLSVTLGALRTETTVGFEDARDSDVLVLNGVEQPGEQPRLTACMDALRDLAGRRVATLHAGACGAGDHTVTWDGRDDRGRAAATGAYIIRLATDAEVRSGRVMLVR